MEYITQEEIDAFNRIKGKIDEETSAPFADKEIVKVLNKKFTHLAELIKLELNGVQTSQAKGIINPSGTPAIKKSLWYRIFPNQIWLDLGIALTFSFKETLDIMVDSWNWPAKSEKRKKITDLRTDGGIIEKIEIKDLLNLNNYESLKQRLISFYEKQIFPIKEQLLAIAKEDAFDNTEENIGLLDSDRTDWKETHLKESSTYKYSIVWNDRNPDGVTETIDSLRKTIERNSFFDLYYLAHKLAEYKAEVIDIATSDADLEQWQNKYGAENILHFQTQIKEIKNDKITAKIVYLCKSFQKLSEKIPESNFTTVRGKYSRVKRVVPFYMNGKPNNNKMNAIAIPQEGQQKLKKEIPLNQIFFGPPGTGKTHRTINEAIKIINPNFNLNQDRKTVKAEFDRLRKKGQIEFTTFHQSMSYEDFVEGIKPKNPEKEGAPVNYVIEDGIFKQLCLKANLTTKEIFSERYKKFVQSLPPLEQEDSDVVLQTKTGSNFWLYQNTANSISVKAGDKSGGMSLALNHLLEVYFDELPPTYESYTKPVIDELVKDLVIDEKNFQYTKPYVLIIDEINRGNVSQIFGELITLLEGSKRLGKVESLTVKLPYSKKSFGVPPNLHLIGTMNTADRSVEALDSALRRRFSFKEIPPDAKIIEEHGQLKSNKGKLIINDNYTIDLVKILNTINERIEILLDRDHLIGHSYFLKIKDAISLKKAFSESITPLLQEYFYGDYAKIILVLGEGFCIGEKVDRKKFAKIKKSPNYDTSIYDEHVIYRLVNVFSKEFNLELAIRQLLGEENTIDE